MTHLGVALALAISTGTGSGVGQGHALQDGPLPIMLRMRAPPAGGGEADTTPPDASDEDDADGDGTQPPEQVAPNDEPLGPTMDQALETGDLTSALEIARAEREANPSVEAWTTEGAVLETMADWAGARDAYTAGLALAEASEDESSVDALRVRLERVESNARGTVADEPDSTHRERFDTERAERNAPEPPPEPEPEPEPEPATDDRIIKKWYFWVTIASIAASGAAIAGLAIKNAVEENASASGTAGVAPRAARGWSDPAPVLFRF